MATVVVDRQYEHERDWRCSLISTTKPPYFALGISLNIRLHAEVGFLGRYVLLWHFLPCFVRKYLAPGAA